MKRAGFVLVGGRSSRMGRDKALLPYRGGTLVEHIASSVRDAAGSVTLVGPPERYRTLGFPVVADRIPGSGPLGGILTALTVSEAELNLVVACDMPSLSPAFLGALLAAAEESEGDCVVPVSPSGRLEPLCAVYHRCSLPAIRQAVEDGRRKVIDVVAELHAVRWPISEAAWFDNLNTPTDWAMHSGNEGRERPTEPAGQPHG